ncbi:BON domain-containing protein [Kribbella sp. VKM Ac-2527]|uniref:BON domain-containing protein n=1 Tax=Kribbella caucasensis TaxID=2512215 RepID=A0A4R6KDY0_9ACTN|nr:BON domain-containing protein [Kribbella sp. VKM Ac-2527]TDO48681.1 BON domain-containing protein [Kribbella sp. VKM Ac-2527]
MRLAVHRISRPAPQASRREQLLKAAGLTAVSASAGAVTEYLLDPERGHSRRARLRDKTAHAAHEVNEGLEGLSRDLSNRGRGVAAGARYRVVGRMTDDAVLHDRVRAELGRQVSHPHAIQVEVDDRTVTLTGDVLAAEADQAIRAINRIPGVRDVETQWRVYDEPGDVPTLQGRARPGKPQSGLRQENWSPTARLLTAAGVIASWPLSSRLPATVRWTMRGAGSVLAARALTNQPLRHLARRPSPHPTAPHLA